MQLRALVNGTSAEPSLWPHIKTPFETALDARLDEAFAEKQAPSWGGSVEGAALNLTAVLPSSMGDEFAFDLSELLAHFATSTTTSTTSFSLHFHGHDSGALNETDSSDGSETGGKSTTAPIITTTRSPIPTPGTYIVPDTSTSTVDVNIDTGDTGKHTGPLDDQ